MGKYNQNSLGKKDKQAYDNQIVYMFILFTYMSHFVMCTFCCKF